MGSNNLRKERINEDQVIHINGNNKDHFIELQVINEINKIFYPYEINKSSDLIIQERAEFNGYGNVFGTTCHINQDKGEITEMYIRSCFGYGVSAVPTLYRINGASSSNLLISVNGDSGVEISKKRLNNLSEYIIEVLSSNELIKLPRNKFGFKLKKYLKFLKRISELNEIYNLN